jgi:hypothetical protein
MARTKNRSSFLRAIRVSSRIWYCGFGPSSGQHSALHFVFAAALSRSRTFSGQIFDLQVVPQKLLPELKRNPSGCVFQTIPATDQVPEVASWLRSGALDLTESGNAFRNFVWRSQRIGEVFPEAKCGKVLKVDLFGATKKSPLEGSKIDEEACLRLLGRCSSWSSFDAVDLELRDRGRKFWIDQPGRGKALLLDLLDSPTNPLGDEIVAGCVDALTIPEACGIAKDRPGLLLALVTRNPVLVLSSAFWQYPIPAQTYLSVLDFLASHRESALPPSAWIPFLLGVGDDQIANSVVERFPNEVINTFLNQELIGDGGDRPFVGSNWRAAISRHQSELVSFLGQEEYRNSSRALTLLAGLLDPHQAQVRSVGLSPWVKIAKETPDAVLAFPNGEAASFLLSLAFQNADPDSVILAATCFEHVHAGARDDARDPLSYRAWKSLEPDVPVLGYTKNWDHCERLRRALVERFAHRSWPREQFLQCVNRPLTLQSMFYSCREVRGGEDFMLGIAAGVLNGSLSATEPQGNLFRSYFTWNRKGVLRMKL